MLRELTGLQALLRASAKRSQMSQDESVEAWKPTVAYACHYNDIGAKSFINGVCDAVSMMERALGALGMKESWPNVMTKFDQLNDENNRLALASLIRDGIDTADVDQIDIGNADADAFIL